MAVRIAIGLLVTLALLWVALLLAAVLIRPRGMSWSEGARLLPDVVVLVHGLARDHRVPRRLRVRLLLLVAWMLSPLDLVPDIIPVVGWADDLVVLYVVLRGVVRRTGPEILRQHWRGSSASFFALERLLGLPPSRPPAGPTASEPADPDERTERNGEHDASP